MKYWLILLGSLTLVLSACSDNDNKDSAQQKQDQDKPVKVVSLAASNVQKIVYSTGGPNSPETGRPYKRIAAVLANGEIQMTSESGNEDCAQLQLDTTLTNPEVGAEIAKIIGRSSIEYYDMKFDYGTGKAKGYAYIFIHFENGELETIDLEQSWDYQPGVRKIMTTTRELMEQFTKLVEFGHSKALINTECP